MDQSYGLLSVLFVIESCACLVVFVYFFTSFHLNYSTYLLTQWLSKLWLLLKITYKQWLVTIVNTLIIDPFLSPTIPSSKTKLEYHYVFSSRYLLIDVLVDPWNGIQNNANNLAWQSMGLAIYNISTNSTQNDNVTSIAHKLDPKK
jgi:hypothetical protein